jgi:hypothetical protein
VGTQYQLIQYQKISTSGFSTSGSVPVIPKPSMVLGLKWNKKEDWLCCDLGELEISAKVTKRTVLATAQKIFDPLGFLRPVLLCPKRLLQEAWYEKTEWDEELSPEMKERYGNWCEELDLMKGIRIPRNMTGG